MYKRCDNCIFSTYMMGVSRPMLMCRFKGNFEGKWREVLLVNSCGNFYPSSNFKLGLYIWRVIPVTRGKFAVVDGDDYYQLSRYRWHAVFNSKTFYAARIERGKTIKMHREIMGAPKHLVVDHVDRNGLNNRKGNLRLCSTAENSRNTRSKACGTSRYKGVHWNKGVRKWAAAIQNDKKTHHIGYFSDEIAAAKAYDKKARELFGEYGYLNFPPEAGTKKFKLQIRTQKNEHPTLNKEHPILKEGGPAHRDGRGGFYG